MSTTNTLTGLIPTIYESMDIVARELVGFIPSVYRNAAAERAARGQTVRYPIIPAVPGEDITPGRLPADSGGATYSFGDMSISRARAYPVLITGEETRGLQNAATFDRIMRDRFSQALRSAVNDVEADIAATYVAASRAVGTAGTTPFASSFADAANVQRILDDNGAPKTGRSLVIDTAAAANMRGLSGFTAVSAAGASEGLRRGIILPLYGLDIRESAQVRSHVRGTGASYQINHATSFPVGTTALAVDTGSGTILAGDVLAIVGDANRYVVTTALAAGTVTIARPGTLLAAADNAGVTHAANYRANMAFHRDAIHLVTRAPAAPEGGDAADDVALVTDPVSGITFELRAYRLYRQVKYEIGLAWGCAMVKPEFAALLLG